MPGWLHATRPRCWPCWFGSHNAPLAAGQHSLIAFPGEVLQPPSTSAPSATARAAAARLVEQTRQGIAKYPNANQRGPDLGGAVWGWHMHNNVCLTLVPLGLLGVATPYGFCPTGAIGVNTAEMLHVWTVNNPTGPFGDLDERFLKFLRSQ